MALTDKVRPHNPKIPVPSVTSPGAGRRGPSSPRHAPGMGHPLAQSRLLPVRLTHESSSVVSLGHMLPRKPIRTGKTSSLICLLLLCPHHHIQCQLCVHSAALVDISIHPSLHRAMSRTFFSAFLSLVLFQHSLVQPLVCSVVDFVTHPWVIRLCRLCHFTCRFTHLRTVLQSAMRHLFWCYIHPVDHLSVHSVSVSCDSVIYSSQLFANPHPLILDRSLFMVWFSLICSAAHKSCSLSYLAGHSFSYPFIMFTHLLSHSPIYGLARYSSSNPSILWLTH